MASLLSRNKTLVLVVKNYPEIDIKVFSSCLILLYLLTLCHKFLSAIEDWACHARELLRKLRDYLRPILKNCSFSITRIAKNKVTRTTGKTFLFTLFNMFKLNISCYFKCYLHHNCSINVNWNSTQLCSSAKPLLNVPSSALWFVNFCLLSFLSKTNVQEWKRIWFCYVHEWIG